MPMRYSGDCEIHIRWRPNGEFYEVKVFVDGRWIATKKIYEKGSMHEPPLSTVYLEPRFHGDHPAPKKRKLMRLEGVYPVSRHGLERNSEKTLDIVADQALAMIGDDLRDAGENPDLLPVARNKYGRVVTRRSPRRSRHPKAR